MSREVMQQALEALDDAMQMLLPKSQSDKARRAAYALHAALAEQAQPEPEPIGEVVIGEEGMVKGWTVVRWRADLPPIAPGTKLYTTPPPPTPVVPQPVAAYKVRITGRWHEAEPTAAAFNLPDGEHLLYTTPPAPVVSQPLTELPPLPEPVRKHDGQPLYGSGQMRAYARAVEAEVLKRMGVKQAAESETPNAELSGPGRR